MAILHLPKLLGETQAFDSMGNVQLWWALSGKEDREGLSHRGWRRASLSAGGIHSKSKSEDFIQEKLTVSTSLILVSSCTSSKVGPSAWCFCWKADLKG